MGGLALLVDGVVHVHLQEGALNVWEQILISTETRLALELIAWQEDGVVRVEYWVCLNRREAGHHVVALQRGYPCLGVVVNLLHDAGHVEDAGLHRLPHETLIQVCRLKQLHGRRFLVTRTVNQCARNHLLEVVIHKSALSFLGGVGFII